MKSLVVQAEIKDKEGQKSRELGVDQGLYLLKDMKMMSIDHQKILADRFLLEIFLFQWLNSNWEKPLETLEKLLVLMCLLMRGVDQGAMV